MESAQSWPARHGLNALFSAVAGLAAAASEIHSGLLIATPAAWVCATIGSGAAVWLVVRTLQLYAGVSVVQNILVLLYAATVGFAVASAVLDIGWSGRSTPGPAIWFAVTTAADAAVWWLVRMFLRHLASADTRELIMTMLGYASLVSFPMLTASMDASSVAYVLGSIYDPNRLWEAAIAFATYVLALVVLWSGWLTIRLMLNAFKEDRRSGAQLLGVLLISLSYACVAIVTRRYADPFVRVATVDVWWPALLCCLMGVGAILYSRRSPWFALAGLPLVGVVHVTDQVFSAANCATLFATEVQRPWIFLGWLFVTLVVIWTSTRRMSIDRYDVWSLLWPLATAALVVFLSGRAAWANLADYPTCDGRYYLDLHPLFGPFFW